MSALCVAAEVVVLISVEWGWNPADVLCELPLEYDGYRQVTDASR
jgi:hypothetical protein